MPSQSASVLVPHWFGKQTPNRHSQSAPPSPAEQSVAQAPQFFGSESTLVSQPSVASPLQSRNPLVHLSTAHAPAGLHRAVALGKKQGSQLLLPQPVFGSLPPRQMSSPVVSGQALAPGKQVPPSMGWVPAPPPLPSAPTSKRSHSRAQAPAAKSEQSASARLIARESSRRSLHRHAKLWMPGPRLQSR